MISALEKNEKYLKGEKEYSDCNGDHDFGTVLAEFSSDITHEHVFRYHDGTEEKFSFNG